MRQAISLLVKRWALNAPALLKSTPEDLGLTRETGFPVDYTLPQAAGGLLPPMEVFNQMWGELTTVIWEINRHGCGLPYDDGQDYVLPCLVTGSDNVYYEAVQANGPSSQLFKTQLQIRFQQHLLENVCWFGGDTDAASATAKPV